MRPVCAYVCIWVHQTTCLYNVAREREEIERCRHRSKGADGELCYYRDWLCFLKRKEGNNKEIGVNERVDWLSQSKIISAKDSNVLSRPLVGMFSPDKRDYICLLRSTSWVQKQCVCVCVCDVSHKLVHKKLCSSIRTMWTSGSLGPFISHLEKKLLWVDSFCIWLPTSLIDLIIELCLRVLCVYPVR